MSTSTQPVTQMQVQMLADAKAYHHITTPGTPAGWYFGSDGRLIDTQTGMQVPLDPARVPYNGFWNQLLHAAPYIAGAGVMGYAGALSTGAGAVGGGASAASTLGPSTAANMAATTAAANAAPAGIAAASTIAPTVGSTFMGMTSGDLARYGLGTAGNIVNGIIQSRAQGKAFDEQQKLLAEALAYQKEQDAYARQRQSGLDAQDVARYGYTTGVDAARYGDTQQQYLSEFDRNENRYAYSTDLEASRYADYRKAVAPYLQSGASANDRAASLLGLPAGAPFDPSLTPGPTRTPTPRPTLSNPGSGFGGGPAVDRTGQNFDPAYVGKMVDDLYAQYGLKATGPGSGPTDKQYMVNAIIANKGWEPYWQTRIPDELRKAGLIH